MAPSFQSANQASSMLLLPLVFSVQVCDERRNPANSSEAEQVLNSTGARAALRWLKEIIDALRAQKCAALSANIAGTEAQVTRSQSIVNQGAKS